MNFTEGKDIYIIHFAFATTGFHGEVCQIAAMGEDDESPWTVNILPDGNFNPHASTYNGYTSRVGTDGFRHLFKEGVKVETCTLLKGIEGFLHYVVSKANNSTHTTLLIAWNSQKFHVPLLLRMMKKCKHSINIFKDSDICYGDPYIMIERTQQQFPQLSEASNLRLPHIYQKLYPGNTLNPKDASHIVQMLKSVLSSLKVTKESLKGHSFTLSSAERVRKYRLRVKKNLLSMRGKLYRPRRPGGTKGIITECMAEKIAESGLNYQELKKKYRGCGREGLEALLKDPLPRKEGERQAKPRVTTRRNIIEAIVTYFEQKKIHCR
jgi:hypothetical protein